MSLPHPHRAAVPPVADGVPRPRWSVMIPTYNCAGFLRETLASVLAQDPGPGQMQITVVDDHSTRDDPGRVVAELGGGRVEFVRQPANVGSIANFDTCLRLARGELVHLLHGDDAVDPGFYATMERPFLEHPGIGAAFCRHRIMDGAGRVRHTGSPLQPAAGILPNWLETIGQGQRLQTPCMVVRRAVYERLGGFDHRIRCYGEDWEMWVRIAAHYPVWYQPEALARYRIHDSSVSGRTQRTGENGADLRTAIALVREHLPPHLRDRVADQASLSAALAFARRARRAARLGDTPTARAQLREVLRFSRRPPAIAAAALSALVLPMSPLLRTLRR
jgi:GT2 family glycosyltransferase